MLDYGLRADDPAFRELQQGLSMLAAVPYGSIPDDAYAAWQDEGREAYQQRASRHDRRLGRARLQAVGGRPMHRTQHERP
jgi:hypothetical protein